MMDLDKGDAAVENSIEEKAEVLEENEILEPYVCLEGNAILEPYVGMEFESEDDARKFYTEYARQVGFVVRIMQRRRSGIDGRTLARRLGCNKQGFSPNHKGPIGPEKKPRPSAREGCKATILVKMEKSGKWVVTRFVRDHNHPLVVTSNGYSTEGDKDGKIEELTKELEHQEQLCAIYRERLFSFMNNVEEQTEELSSKIQVIVDNVRQFESGVQKFSHHR
ncbi:protein FAR1-RELATED SEQUENCE 5 [Tripterygium wilfordii]|uniref:Protein FAR1-RELATED SEQUENCE 5 n=1 Tax=Tripterygium wilfordii TaxID=458696 RepID=A0A7J7BY51_TRIWF|nr:protein FAR1-RELATED SEQUENCE 3-like [Tripterygium wilfordii]KAF5726547.1 protein FAR1-RELATED SEQUENCE 5 [Tripterygium wilfordii]